MRFDAVYLGHFKCNLRRIVDYPHLSGYLRDLYQHPGIAATVDFDHIKRHYYITHDDQPDPHRPARARRSISRAAWARGRVAALVGRAATAVTSMERPGTISCATTVTRAG